MNKSIIKNSVVALTVAVVAGVVMISATSKPVSAAASGDACKAQPTGALSINGTTVSGQFKIPEGCPTQLVTLMVYKTTGQIFPLSAQKMFSYDTGTYPAGTFTASTNLPDNCFYQADLFRSGPVTQLEDKDYNDILMSFKLGGSKDCLAATPAVVTPTPTPTPTPAVVTTAAVTPAAPTAPAAPAAKPTALPNTGPGNIAAVVSGVALTSGLAYNLVARRRSQA